MYVPHRPDVLVFRCTSSRLLTHFQFSFPEDRGEKFTAVTHVLRTSRRSATRFWESSRRVWFLSSVLWFTGLPSACHVCEVAVWNLHCVSIFACFGAAMFYVLITDRPLCVCSLFVLFPSLPSNLQVLAFVLTCDSTRTMDRSAMLSSG